jgi:hypothetical protein
MSKIGIFYMAMATAVFTAAVLVFKKRYRRHVYFTKGDGRMITKENIRRHMPDCNRRMTDEEFERERRVRNNDRPFSELLSEIPDAEGSHAELMALVNV